MGVARAARRAEAGRLRRRRMPGRARQAGSLLEGGYYEPPMFPRLATNVAPGKANNEEKPSNKPGVHYTKLFVKVVFLRIVFPGCIAGLP